MLDGFIIEELRRREEAERNKAPRPVIELPLPDRRDDHAPGQRDADTDPSPSRGVIVIDL